MGSNHQPAGCGIRAVVCVPRPVKRGGPSRRQPSPVIAGRCVRSAACTGRAVARTSTDDRQGGTSANQPMPAAVGGRPACLRATHPQVIPCGTGRGRRTPRNPMASAFSWRPVAAGGARNEDSIQTVMMKHYRILETGGCRLRTRFPSGVPGFLSMGAEPASMNAQIRRTGGSQSTWTRRR